MNVWAALLRKEFLVELRSKETVVALLGLAMLLATVAVLGIQESFLEKPAIQRVVPVLIWLITFFSASAALGRSLESDLEYRALDGLLLTGISPITLYFVKLFSGGCFSLLGHAAVVCMIATVLDVAPAAGWGAFAMVSLAALVGFDALLVLLSAISSVARLRGLLLPIILFPLLTPLLMAVFEESFAVFVSGAWSPASFWFDFLLLLDVIYVVLGMNLYGVALRD
jgi:heme exporter protein B